MTHLLPGGRKRREVKSLYQSRQVCPKVNGISVGAFHTRTGYEELSKSTCLLDWSVRIGSLNVIRSYHSWALFVKEMLSRQIRHQISEDVPLE